MGDDVRSLFPRALADEPDGKVTHTVNGSTETWRIDEPNVKKPFLEFSEVTFLPGDKVTVGGGGCVQTGGAGQTWKRYVDPLGPNSDRLYHGMVLIPGAIGQLPANSLGNFARILIVRGHQFTVGAIDEPRKAHLWLGYEDDDYSDNGYWGQDAGTQGQCRIGDSWVEHAFAVVTIVHGGTPPPPQNVKPFDLSVNTITANNPAVDDNDILFNPVWGAQLPPSSKLPNASNCDPSSLPSDPKNCTTQTTTWDASDICTVRGWFTGDAGGHRNWAAGTYQGRLYWEAHSAPGTDDDYNFRLVAKDQAGLTVDNGKTEATGEPSLGLEFDSDETIDHFNTPWWNKLHAAVDADDEAHAVLQDAIRYDPPGVAAAQAAFDRAHKALTTLTDGKTAIVTGLVGLDGAHGYYTELHPVWAMAILVNDDPADETWAIFVRRWGNEGFCSGDQHYLDDLQGDRIVFRLPWRPGFTAVGKRSGTQFLTRLGQATGPGLTPVFGKGVLVSFTMPVPQSGDGERLHGELHLNWTGNVRPEPGGVRGQLLDRSLSVGVRGPGLQTVTQINKDSEPEARVAAAIAALTPAQRQTFKARLPQSTPGFDSQLLQASAPTDLQARAPTDMTDLRRERIVLKRPTTRAVPDPQKRARDQQRLAAFRAVSAQAISLDDGRQVSRPVGVISRPQ